LIYELVRHTFISASRSAAVPELWTLGAAMKLSRHLIVILLVAAALTASAQLFLVKRLVPKNVPSSDERFTFTISSSKIGSSVHFSITVAPKKAIYPLSTDVRVMLFDGTGEISQFSLDDQGQEKGKPYHYTFDVGTNYLAYSQFIFRYSDWTNHISGDDADSIFFFLRDF
jgi:hypothetical protein